MSGVVACNQARFILIQCLLCVCCCSREVASRQSDVDCVLAVKTFSVSGRGEGDGGGGRQNRKRVVVVVVSGTVTNQPPSPPFTKGTLTSTWEGRKLSNVTHVLCRSSGRIWPTVVDRDLVLKSEVNLTGATGPCAACGLWSFPLVPLFSCVKDVMCVQGISGRGGGGKEMTILSGPLLPAPRRKFMAY